MAGLVSANRMGRIHHQLKKGSYDVKRTYKYVDHPLSIRFSEKIVVIEVLLQT
jgi:hypothetical protein